MLGPAGPPAGAGDDTSLVLRAQEGDASALETLVHRHYAAIYRLAYRMLHHQQDAEDATQETFVRAFRRLDTFRLGERFSPWLYRIALNRCIEVSRRRKTTGHDSALDESTVAAGVDPEGEVLEREQSRALNHRIQSLPEHYRVPLVLFHQEGMSYEEVAEVMRMPINSVKSRLHRGRELLRRSMEDLL